MKQRIDISETPHGVFASIVSVCISPNSITRNISTLRAALGECSRDCQYIETVPWRGYRFVASVKEVRDESTHPGFGSIAVLPFVNAAGDPDIEYLADGITESLITSLSQLPRLKVLSRNSAFRYKSRDLDAQSVGRELKVQAVLIGRISQRDQQLSISVELVDAVDDSHIWGAQYNRKPEEIFTTQSTIAREIAERLRLRLTGAEQQQLLTKRQTDDPVAYTSYLIIGHLKARRGDTSGARKILDELAEAIAQGINVSPYMIAAIHSALGEREFAFDWLDKAYEQREIHLVSLKVDPFLDGIRADDRFDALVRRVGLPVQ